MRLPRWIGTVVLHALQNRVSSRRPPDVFVGGEVNPYLLRWHVIPRNQWFNVYLHRFLRSDDDRALHDHPAANLSWLLSGSYIEVVPVMRRHFTLLLDSLVRSPGQLLARAAKSPHRIVVPPHVGPVWTLFVSGPKRREWGFLCPAGWRPWHQFLGARDYNSGEGPGCD